MATKTLLENAIRSIENGFEDFEAGDGRSTSAVRNLFAGVLLLLKEALRRESPEGSNDVLIYQRFIPKRGEFGKVILVGDGKSTVDYQELHRRCNALGIDVEWKRLERLQKIRNNVEHGAVKDETNTIREAVGAVFVLAPQILTEHLGVFPHEVFDPDLWSRMASEAEVEERLERESNESFQSLGTAPSALLDALEFVECTACGSHLVTFEEQGVGYGDMQLTCLVCGFEQKLAYQLEDILVKVSSPFDDLQDIVECDDCGGRTYSRQAELCLHCGCFLGDYSLESG